MPVVRLVAARTAEQPGQRIRRGTRPAELLGRAYAVNSSGLMTAQALGFAAAGALGEAVPPDLAIALTGTAGLVVVALCRPRLHQRPQPRKVDLQE
jgi:hypothetical protein